MRKRKSNFMIGRRWSLFFNLSRFCVRDWTAKMIIRNHGVSPFMRRMAEMYSRNYKASIVTYRRAP